MRMPTQINFGVAVKISNKDEIDRIIYTVCDQKYLLKGKEWSLSYCQDGISVYCDRSGVKIGQDFAGL